jgi:annexin A7/11
LIDVICQTSNAELAQIKAMYPGLEKEVEKETSGNFRKVLLELLKCKRDESLMVNEREAEADAVTLYNAGEKKLGTDDSAFIRLFTTRSVAHLAAVDR